MGSNGRESIRAFVRLEVTGYGFPHGEFLQRRNCVRKFRHDVVTHLSYAEVLDARQFYVTNGVSNGQFVPNAPELLLYV